MARYLRHAAVEGRKVFRSNPFQDFPGCVQILFVVGVDVLGVVGLDKIVALPGQHHSRVFQNGPQVIPRKDPGLSGPKGFPREIPAVMAQAQVVAVQVLPGPVKGGKLAEGFVLFRYMPPRIVVEHIRNRVCMQSGACLHILIDAVIALPIGLVAGHHDGVFLLHCAPPGMPCSFRRGTQATDYRYFSAAAKAAAMTASIS